MIPKIAIRGIGFLFVILVTNLGQLACDGSRFTAANPIRKVVEPTPQPVGTGGSPGGNSTGDDAIPPQITPQACDRGSLKAAPVGQNCPENYGVFGIDDPGSSQSFGTLACCPLPATDILSGTAITRSQQCGANEIMIGNTGAGVNCRPINAARYQLRPAQVCYFGDGSSGQGRAPRCGPLGVIPTQFSAFANVNGGGFMGNDGCLNYPYGSLSVGQAGRNCDNQTAVQLFTLDGSPVTMFK